jgi:hypothetical protein
MNKVIAFFEKYAEWMALGVAGVFLLFMIWSYVINPTDAQVKVGTDEMLPGDVEPTVNVVARQLESKMNAGGKPEIVVPNFSEQFTKSIGPDRPRGISDPLVANVTPYRPFVPGATFVPGGQQQPQGPALVQILPQTPAAKFSAFYAGQSYVLDPNNAANQAAMQAQGGGNPQPFNPQNVQAVAGIDKSYVTVEFNLDVNALAAAWKVAFPDPTIIPKEALETFILRCVVEREEQLSPGKWGNKIELQPLPLQKVEKLPAAGNKVAEAIYDAWAKENQVVIAEPSFYQIIDGDLKEGWRPPSMIQAEAAAKAQAGVQQVMNQPFDPATYQGPIEALTPQQKSQLYQFRIQQKKEKDRMAADERKQKAMQAEAQRNARRPVPSGGGRGGGYNNAPLPEGVQLAQAPGERRGSMIEEEMGLRRGPTPPPGYDRRRNPNQKYDDAGRPIGPATPGPVPGPANPNIANVPFQGVLPTQPFNPIDLAAQAPAQAAPVPGQPAPATNLVCWAHDDAVAPGKIYRYRMQVLFKNPLHGTAGLAKNKADEDKYVLDPAAGANQGWSDWSKDVRVAPTAFYFFANAKQAMHRGVVVNAIVDVFKREKGKWIKGTFTVTPGDSIGQPQGFVDYTTGDTLVDLRSEFRGDVRIITADQAGELKSLALSQYQKDPQYMELQNQLREAGVGPDGQPLQPGTPAPVVPAGYDRGPVPPRNTLPPPGRLLRDNAG